MDEKIRPIRKGAVVLVCHSARMPIGQLIVGEKDERFSILLEAVPQSLVWMADRNGGYVQAAELQCFPAFPVILNVRPDLFKTHREIGGSHDKGDHFPDGFLREGTAEKRDPSAGPVNGLKERKAHDVIPVGMGEDHRILGTFFGD